jgi:hypothetical protein
MTAYCKSCGLDLDFDQSQVGKNGKLIPLDVKTRERHECKFKPTTKCNRCEAEIHFSPYERTKDGKYIPLGKTGGHHRCRANPFNKQTRRSYMVKNGVQRQ